MIQAPPIPPPYWLFCARRCPAVYSFVSAASFVHAASPRVSSLVPIGCFVHGGGPPCIPLLLLPVLCTRLPASLLFISYWLFCARRWSAVCSTLLSVRLDDCHSATLAARRIIDCERNIVSIVVHFLPPLTLCTAVVRRVTNFAWNILFCYFDFTKSK